MKSGETKWKYDDLTGAEVWARIAALLASEGTE